MPHLLQLIINLKNKPEAVEKIHSFCAIYFCLYMLVFTGVSIRCGAGAGGSRSNRTRALTGEALLLHVGPAE